MGKSNAVKRHGTALSQSEFNDLHVKGSDLITNPLSAILP